MTGPAHDPITFSVIQAGLTAAADEMFAVLKKTAGSGKKVGVRTFR